MARPAVVVSDVSRNGLVLELITQARKQPAKLLGGKQIKQHQNVGLLRQFVAVRSVVLCLQDEIEALDIAVPGAIVIPIQLDQLLVALELADDPVTMKREIHP